MDTFRKTALSMALVTVLLAGFAAADPSLTVYNQNFAVVRDTVPLDLKAGDNEVTYTEMTGLLEPDSVVLRDPAGQWQLQIVEQNYRNDPVSQQLLLSLYEGKTVTFLVPRGDDVERVKGTIVRSGYAPQQNNRGYYQPGNAMQPVIRIDDELRFGLPGTPLFPAVNDQAKAETILKPTVQWLIASNKAGKFDAELSYVTGGFTWEADYNVISPEKGDDLSIAGWVTVDNKSGKTFKNAQLKLMAGDVNKIQPQQPQVMYARKAMAADAMAAAPAVSEKAFDEFHLYSVARRTTLRDQETKQIDFVSAEGVKSQRLYIYDGADIGNQYRYWSPEQIVQNRGYGTQCNKKVWVMREFKNTETNHLGIALPKGRVRFYRRDGESLEFVGENMIDHTPKDEDVRLYTGDSFDLVGERKQTNYVIDTNRRILDESFEIKLRNHKEEPVEIRVVEHLYRSHTWEITQATHDFNKTDARTIEFRIPVQPDGEQVIKYTVHYTW